METSILCLRASLPSTSRDASGGLPQQQPAIGPRGPAERWVIEMDSQHQGTVWSSHRAWWLLLALSLFACSGGGGGGGCGGGCGGCGRTVPYPATAPSVENGIQARISRPGLDFIEDNAGGVVDQFLDTGLTFCAPQASSPVPMCWARTCPSTGETGCELSLSIDDVQLDAVDPGTIRATVTIGGLDQSEDFLEVQLLSECVVKLGTENNAGLPASLDVIFQVDPVTRDIALKVDTDNIQIDFDRLDIGIAPLDPNDIGAIIVCGGVDLLTGLGFVRDLLFGVIQGQLDSLIQPLIGDFLCRTCETNADCPQGNACVTNDAGTNVCWDAAQDVCVPLLLGLEGELDFGALLASVSPGLEALLLYQIKAFGYADALNQGLSIGVKGGTYADKAECVPTVPPPSTAPVAHSPVLEGNLAPDGQPFHIGLGVSEAFFDEALWGVFNSGGLCLSIGTATSDFITTGTFATLLPSLRGLTGGRNTPMIIQLAPQQPPTIDVGSGELDADGNIINPLLTLHWDNLNLEFHAFFNERYVRIFTLNTDLVVPLGLDATDEGIIPVIGDLTDAFARLEVRDSELLEEEASFLEALLPSIVSLALPLLGDSLSQPIALPEFSGFRIVLRDGSFTGIENNTMLGVFVNLAFASGMNLEGLPPVDTNAWVVDLSLPDPALLTARPDMTEQERVLALFDARPRLTIEAEALIAGQRLEGESLEYSYQVDHGLWSTFRRDPLIVIDEPLLLLQGHHHIAVRARLQGDVETLDRTPAELDVLVDFQDPTVDLVREADRVDFVGADEVTGSSDLLYSSRVASGAWTDWSPTTRLDLAPLQTDRDEDVVVEVKVRDEAGREGLVQRTFAIHGRVTRTNPNDNACDCSQVGHGRTAPPFGALLIGLVALGLFAVRRRRQAVRKGHIGVAGLGLLLALGSMNAACDDDAPKAVVGQQCAEICAGGETCRRGACVAEGSCEMTTDCDEGRQCFDGLCVIVECETNDDCAGGQACETDALGNVRCVDTSCAQDNDCAWLDCQPRDGVCGTDGQCTCSSWCDGGCGSAGFCCQSTNACVPVPSACDGTTCDPGFMGEVVEASTGDPKSCQITPGECACVPLPPLPVGTIGRYQDTVDLNGTLYISAYNDTYGDLMLGRVGADRAITWSFIDGVPTDGPVTGQIDGPRGGIATPGPDVGRFTSLDADANGNLTIAYRDETNKDLKVAVGVASADGFTWSTYVVDAEGDTGAWTDVTVGPDNAPSIVFMAPRVPLADPTLPRATSKLRFARAAAALPGATDWTLTDLDTAEVGSFCGGVSSCATGEKCRADLNVCERTASASACNDSCATGEACFGTTCAAAVVLNGPTDLPEGVGLFARAARFSDGRVAIVYYDRSGGDLRYIAQTADGWTAPVILDGRDAANNDVTDAGQFCSIAIDAADNVHIAYIDALTDDLRYLDMTNMTSEIVDDGVRLVGAAVFLNLIGEDSSILIDSEGKVRIAYQDTTHHDLILARRNGPGSWDLITLAGDEGTYQGSFGFYVRQTLVGGQSTVTSFKYNRQVDPAENGIVIHTF